MNIDDIKMSEIEQQTISAENKAHAAVILSILEKYGYTAETKEKNYADMKIIRDLTLLFPAETRNMHVFSYLDTILLGIPLCTWTVEAINNATKPGYFFDEDGDRVDIIIVGIWTCYFEEKNQTPVSPYSTDSQDFTDFGESDDFMDFTDFDGF